MYSLGKSLYSRNWKGLKIVLFGSTYLRTFIAHSRSERFSDVIPNGKLPLAEISSSNLAVVYLISQNIIIN